MIIKYVSDLASRMGIKLTKVSLIDGKTVGCLDTHSLMISSKGCNVSTIVYKTDLVQLEKGNDCHRLESSIREKLSRLQMMIDP